jgi:hypothetical protein
VWIRLMTLKDDSSSEYRDGVSSETVESTSW